MRGKPIPLEDKRTEPTLKVSNSYGSQERLDPGQDASQSVEAEFPVDALKAKHLKEIRPELLYIPSARATGGRCAFCAARAPASSRKRSHGK
jgi:hypothetical protein